MSKASFEPRSSPMSPGGPAATLPGEATARRAQRRAASLEPLTDMASVPPRRTLGPAWISPPGLAEAPPPAVGRRSPIAWTPIAVVVTLALGLLLLWV